MSQTQSERLERLAERTHRTLDAYELERAALVSWGPVLKPPPATEGAFRVVPFKPPAAAYTHRTAKGRARRS